MECSKCPSSRVATSNTHIFSLNFRQGNTQLAREMHSNKRAVSEMLGSTCQASLDPLASINCERIGTLPSVDLYVEALCDARTMLDKGASREARGWAGKNVGVFMSGYSTGDLALWWEVARGWRLGRPFLFYYVCGPRDPRNVRSCEFPVGGDIVDPRRLCSSCPASDAPQDSG